MTSFDPQSIAMGAAVRGALAQAGLSQADTANLIGISLRSLSRCINGALPFTWPNLVKIAEITGVSVANLVADAERIADRTSAA